MSDASPAVAEATAKAPKPPKQAKLPKQADGTKPKSAKELKKEKRAAAVAARGGGDNGEVEARHLTGDFNQQPVVADAARSLTSAAPNLATASPAMTAPVPGPSAPTPSASSSTLASSLRRPAPPEHKAPTDPSSASHLFFSHLPSHHLPSTSAALTSSKLHPTILRVGVLMASGTLRGANSRTMAMMAAFQEVIRDYDCPSNSVLWKDLPVYLSPMIAWLETCRPKGVGGGNAIRWLKSEINRLGEQEELSEAEQKDRLVEAIGVYLRDRIDFADQVIAENAKEKIQPGEVVVTYARSSLVERVLVAAWRSMRRRDPKATFEVVVVDSRPLNEGRNLLRALSAEGMNPTYILLPLLTPILTRTTLVLLGASALHSDGALYARSGTALVAMLAKEHRVPVVACVETYKFGERVTLDGVASNELGKEGVVLDVPVKLGAMEGKNLTPISFMYDLTPPSLITAVCTEIGFIPPSSVPTVLGKASSVA